MISQKSFFLFIVFYYFFFTMCFRMSPSDLSTQNFIDYCQLAGNKTIIKLPGKFDYHVADGYAVSLTSRFLELNNKFQLFRVNSARSSPQKHPERQTHTVSLRNCSGYILIRQNRTLNSSGTKNALKSQHMTTRFALQMYIHILDRKQS